MRRTTLALILALIAAVASAQDASIRRYGLFIGANDGGSDRITLRWAVADAERIAEVMTEIGGVLPQDAYLLNNPSARDVELQFEHLGNRMDADRDRYRRTELVVYYSGHSDESGLMLGNDHMSYVDFRRAIDSVEADVSIAILDSCASGAFTRLKGGSFTQPFLLDEGSEVTGHAFLASSSADEASQESDTLGSSFFTHYLVSGLRGAADSTSDELVTLDEVYLYAREETLKRTINTFAGPQNASFDFQLTGTGSLVLTDLSVLDAAILVDEDVQGRMYITRQYGGILAEVEKEPGKPLLLAVPAGNYVITLQGDDRNYEHEFAVSAGGQTTVSDRDFRVTFLDRNRVRGDAAAPEPLSITVLPGTELVANDPFEVTISLGLLVADVYRVRGGQASTILSVAHENVTGVQFAGVGNTTGGDLTGVQSSGVFNVVNGSMFGAQNAGVFNQVNGDSALVQNAGVFNITNGGFTGLQSAGVFNITESTLNGVQISGVFNRAGAANGAQISLVNVGGDVNGAQIGLVNIGRRVTGTQIGLVNISEEMYGIPIGLASIVERGIHNASIWWEGDERTFVGVQNGSNIFYTLAYAGVTRGGEWRELEGLGVGAGVGFRIDSRPFYLDIDAGYKRFTSGTTANERVANLFSPEAGAAFPTARIMAGVSIGGGLGWFMGASFDLVGPGTRDSIGYFSSGTDEAIPLGAYEARPTYFTGFKF
jgi:hypothetical protein